MTNTNSRTAKWLRWLARGLGSLAAAGWLFVVVASAFDEPGPVTLEGGIVAALALVAAVSVGIAWWREGLGSALVIASALAYMVFAYLSAGQRRGMAMATSGGPFLVAGILFGASWALSRSRRPDEQRS